MKKSQLIKAAAILLVAFSIHAEAESKAQSKVAPGKGQSCDTPAPTCPPGGDMAECLRIARERESISALRVLRKNHDLARDERGNVIVNPTIIMKLEMLDAIQNGQSGGTGSIGRPPTDPTTPAPSGECYQGQAPKPKTN